MTENANKNAARRSIPLFSEKGATLYLRFFFMNHKCITTESGIKITRERDKSACRIA